MNILFINNLFVGFMVSETPILSVFGYFPLYICNHFNRYMYHLYRIYFIKYKYRAYIYIYIYIYIGEPIM